MSNPSAVTSPTDARATASSLPEALRCPEAYPVALQSEITLVETHISWVFLLERDVFKVRKPVNLGFVDFGTLQLRREDCEAEVRLNARLAPDVYRGVVAIWQQADGSLQVGAEPAGPIVDWAVHMRRLPEAQRADTLLSAGELSAAMVEKIARRIAQFHAEQPTDAAIARFGTLAAVWHNVQENFGSTQDTLTRYLDPDEAEELRGAQTRFLQTHVGLLQRRIAGGKVRDTHGDLRLEHIYLTPQLEITVLDCIEFNERFRFADVCADIAFLSMDLSRLGRPDLGELLLCKYVEESQDYELYEVVDFYQSYRAFVRGKIAALIADDPAAALLPRDKAAAEARRCFRLALAAERPALVPAVLVAVGGWIASGKSHVAERLGRALPAVVISADRTRKDLAHVQATTAVHDPTWSGLYSPANTQRVYDELFRRAEPVLRAGRSVVLDASFRTRALRVAALDAANALGVQFHLVECVAPPEVCRTRLAERAKTPSLSDGRLEIFDDFVAKFEQVAELPEELHCVVDTSAPWGVETLLQQIGVEPLPEGAP